MTTLVTNSARCTQGMLSGEFNNLIQLSFDIPRCQKFKLFSIHKINRKPPLKKIFDHLWTILINCFDSKKLNFIEKNRWDFYRKVQTTY